MPSAITYSQATGIKLLWSLTILLATVGIASAQNYPIKSEVGLSQDLYSGNIVLVVKDLELNLNSIRVNGYYFNSGEYYSTMSDRILVVSVADQLNQKPRMGGIATNSSFNLKGGQRRDFWIDVPRETAHVSFGLIINSSSREHELQLGDGYSGSFNELDLRGSLERAFRQELDGIIASIQREEYDRISRLYFQSPADISLATSTLDEMANKFGYSSFFYGNPELVRLLDSTQTAIESSGTNSMDWRRVNELDAMSRRVRGHSLTQNKNSDSGAIIGVLLLVVFGVVIIVATILERNPSGTRNRISNPRKPYTGTRRESVNGEKQVPPSGPRQREAVPPSVSLALEFFDLELPVSESELKSVYRKSMQQYHPDRVASLGEELQELAAKRAKTINEAYSLIKEYLGY